MSKATQRIEGQVETLFFSSPTFSAGKLRTSDGGLVSFAGALMVKESDPVVLSGHWETHMKFGQQFKVSSFTFNQDLSADGLAHYLANHPDIKGIGPAKAKRIAEAFGDKFDDVIQAEPERVAEVAKVPLATAHALRDEWLRKQSMNASLTWLSSFELTHHQMSALIEKFGNSVVTILNGDPFLLVREVPGFGFKRVDAISRKLNIPKESPARIRAGISHCVAERLEQGDCWVEYEELVRLTNELLVMDVPDSKARIEAELDGLVTKKILECVSVGGRFLVAQPAIHKMEAELATAFAANLRGNPHAVKAATKVGLNSAQAKALDAAALHNMVLISGGAGSGKTFTLAAIAKMYEDAGLRVVLAAPTGKAAKRIEQVVHAEAVTLHRLLGFKGKAFTAGPDAPVEADVVIVDEVSMVDVWLAWHLFRAIDFKKTCLVLVGDHNQLPPVGPGNVLRDLIERQPIPTVILDEIVRQAGVLKENSIAILHGEVRQSAAAERGTPWLVFPQNTEVSAAQKCVMHLFDSVLHEKLGFDVLADVQLLTPTRKGPLGVDALNIELQRLVQRKLWGVHVEPPRVGRRPEFLLHDKVIQTRNNYELGVMNGAIGIVTSVGPRRGEMRVRFDDFEVEITPGTEAVRDLALAYALTIHKSQGSEFPCAVLVIHKAHTFMHHRNLFYTGVTRARTTAIVIGDHWGMRNCSQKEQVERRKTFLSVLDMPTQCEVRPW